MPESQSKYSLSNLAARFELQLHGDGSKLIHGVSTLQEAGPLQITFLANRAYKKQLPATRAGAVILREENAEDCPVDCLVAADPYLAYARLANLFDHRPAAQPGIHSTAVIAETCMIGKNVSIGAHAVIGEHCEIGDACTIGPGTVLEADCQLGEGCRLFANVSLGQGVRLGKRVMIHPGAVIGADGFGIAFAGDHWEKVPQLGSVAVGDDCEIGANTCIDRGAIEDTVLAQDVRIDNLVQIAHNVRIGSHTAIAGLCVIAGSTTIGEYCLLGGKSGVGGIHHLEIADRTTVMGGSSVTRSIIEPGKSWSGVITAMPATKWRRIFARLHKLDELAKKVHTIETEMTKRTQNGK
ncbi:UDP-3-O-(3-hydroxymyristoyl)glucosamine N-acyltransferase [Pseudomonadota bacterium]